MFLRIFLSLKRPTFALCFFWREKKTPVKIFEIFGFLHVKKRKCP